MNESRRAVAPSAVHPCALLRIWCSAVYISSLVSCPFCDGRWGRHVGGRHLPPNPKGVTPAVAVTALYFTLPVRSCREESRALRPHPSRIPRIASAVVCQAKHARLQPYKKPLAGRHPAGDLKATSLLKLTPGRWSERLLTSGWTERELKVCDPSATSRCCGTAPPSEPLELKGETQNCTCNEHATIQDDVTSMSSSAMKTRSRETADVHQRDT